MVHLLLVIIYMAFISLGLPDSLLGSAWPTMHTELGVPVSYAGAISMIIACGTVVSSLQSDRLTRRFGTGKVTAFSVATTAVALFGFSVTRSFWLLCLHDHVALACAVCRSQRHVGLCCQSPHVNDGVKDTFLQRATVLRTLRRVLDEAGYISDLCNLSSCR